MTARALRFSMLWALVSLFVTLPLGAQTSAGESPAQVAVLGTYHFANPGADVVQGEVADVLSAVRQEEIRAVVETLARFRPTRVAVEAVPAAAPRLDSLYLAYRAGQHELSRNEIQQLGFRLASRFDHARLYPIDHPGGFPYQAVMEYAQVHDPDFVTRESEEIARMTAEMNRQQRAYTIGRILRLMNDPRELEADHGLYMRYARVGAGDTYVGADLLSKWYERNIHIFANLQRIAEPGDRVLVIVGAGHAPILRELIHYDPEMELMDMLDYLPSD